MKKAESCTYIYYIYIYISYTLPSCCCSSLLQRFPFFKMGLLMSLAEGLDCNATTWKSRRLAEDEWPTVMIYCIDSLRLIRCIQISSNLKGGPITTVSDMVAVTWRERVPYRQICKLLVLTTRVSVSLLDLIPQCTSPRDLRWKCHRLRCSQRHVGSPGTVVVGPTGIHSAKQIVEGVTGVVSEQALITIFISIISPPRVIHFRPYLLFNRMQASMDHLWLFHGILQISTLHFLIICCVCLLSLIQARNHDGTWLFGRSQCSWRAAVRAHDAVRAAFCWSLMWVATGKTRKTWKSINSICSFGMFFLWAGYVLPVKFPWMPLCKRWQGEEVYSVCKSSIQKSFRRCFDCAGSPADISVASP